MKISRKLTQNFSISHIFLHKFAHFIVQFSYFMAQHTP